jgi:hypothetical protein
MTVSNVHHFLPLDSNCDSKRVIYDFAFTIIIFETKVNLNQVFILNLGL